MDEQEQGEKAIARGTALLDLNRNEDAIKALAEGTALLPEDPVAHCFLAQAQLGAEGYEDVLETTARASALAPELEVPHRLRSLALVRLGRTREAVEAAREAVRLDPEFVLGQIALAHALRSSGKRKEALAAAKRAIELDPSMASPHSMLGALLMKKDPEKAIPHFERALSIDPEDALAHNNLGVARLNAGDRSGAMESFEAAGKLDPRLDEPRENLTNTARGLVQGALPFGFAFCAIQFGWGIYQGDATRAIAFGLIVVAMSLYLVVSRPGRREQLSPTAARLLEAERSAPRTGLGGFAEEVVARGGLIVLLAALIIVVALLI